MFQPLDPLLKSELRLAIMSLLISLEKADFKYLKESTKSTAGNLSVQLQKLKDADYIEITKTFKKNYPHTECKITPKGVDAFEQYVKAIQSYINIKGK